MEIEQKNNETGELVYNTIEFGYQKCPACNGTGIDINVRLSSSATPPCPVCNGKRVMSTIVYKHKQDD